MNDLKKCFSIILDSAKEQMISFLRAKLEQENGCIKFNSSKVFFDSLEEAKGEMLIRPRFIYLKDNEIHMNYEYYSVKDFTDDIFDNNINIFNVYDLYNIVKVMD